MTCSFSFLADILLIRGGVEQNPGPTSEVGAPHSEHEASEDVPIGVRNQRGPASGEGDERSTAEFEDLFQAEQTAAPVRKRKRGLGTGAAAWKRKACGAGTGAASKNNRKGGRRAGPACSTVFLHRQEREQAPPVRMGRTREGDHGLESAPETHGDVPEGMSHKEQQAQASWTAAILKVAELKPKSYKDYIRALKTYKMCQK